MPYLVFIAVTAFILGAVSLWREYQKRSAEERLEVLAGVRTADRQRESILKEELISETLSGAGSLFSGVIQRFENLGLLFEQADSPIKPDVFLALSLALGIAGGVVSWLLRSPLPMIPVGVLIGAVLPTGWLFWRRRRRLKRFEQQLPDAVELIARALRSGHSLASGLQVVSQELPDPIGTEFGMAYEEQNLGVPLEQALRNMLKRVPNLDLKLFVTAVAIQRQTGGDLAEVLDKIGYIVRERFKILGHVKALTAEGRLSGVVLMALPIVLFFAMYHLNPDYVMFLFENETGRKMIAGALILQVLGALAIKKIVTIQV
ncbi:MAG: secretion protein [Planctomycetota bacterium]|nr:MAG: secretion protein [Planctomycetota bacterium]